MVDFIGQENLLQESKAWSFVNMFESMVPGISDEPEKENYTERPKMYRWEACYASDATKWTSWTPTVLAFDTFYGNSTYMKTATSEALTLPVSGRYLIIWSARWSSNATSYRALFIYVNWSATFHNSMWARSTVAAANWASTSNLVVCKYEWTKWDYIQLYWAQESWSDRTLSADSTFLQVTQLS